MSVTPPAFDLTYRSGATMTRRTVHTQTELDTALRDHVDIIEINSDLGVWLEVRATGSATVRATGSATVRAYNSATVRAGSKVAVHLHDARVQVQGGVVIDVTDINRTGAENWADYYGLKTTDGKLTVFKAVDDTLHAGHQHLLTEYPIGSTVTAPDWNPTPHCGNGLHFAATPHHAERYYTGTTRIRYLACEIDTATLTTLNDKVKAPTCHVLHEVDLHGRALQPVNASTSETPR